MTLADGARALGDHDRSAGRACVLLVGASLLNGSFVALLHADRGYDPANVLRANSAAGRLYDAAPHRLLETLTARLRAVPACVTRPYGNALPLLTAGGFRALKMRPPRTRRPRSTSTPSSASSAPATSPRWRMAGELRRALSDSAR